MNRILAKFNKDSLLSKGFGVGGFTLIEMLVAVSLFVLIILISIGTLLNLANANSRTQAILVAINNLDFAMEHMSRNLRTGHDYLISTDNNTVSFVDAYDIPILYYYDVDTTTNRGTIKRVKNSRELSLTAPEVDIKEVKFYLQNPGYSQPRLLITVSGKTAVSGLKDKEQAEFHLQTLVSQRVPAI